MAGKGDEELAVRMIEELVTIPCTSVGDFRHLADRIIRMVQDAFKKQILRKVGDI